MYTDFISIIEKNRFFKNFNKDNRLIFSVILIIFVWTLVYLVLFYHPSYESEAKVWIKDLETKEFITSSSLETQSQLTSLTAAGNPLLTQIEILKSDQLKKIIVIYKSLKGEEVSLKSININVKNKPNTDILNISYKAKSPKEAQEILKLILKEYEKTNLEINSKITRARREYIDLKLKEISEKLLDVRKQIKEYKTKNLAIDITEESMKLVDQGITTSSQLDDTVAQIKNTSSSIGELETHLSMNSKTAINAVALGSGNKILEQLRNDLNAETQAYEFDSAKLADTNPKMVAHKNKINTINKQIKNQVVLSIGKYAKAQKINIFDPVREELVRDLASKQTELMGLQAQERAIRNSITEINQTQSKMPEKKFVLDNLEQEEKVLGNAYDQLKEKQIEARLKEAEAVSNVIVVDQPSLPTKKSFPSRLNILIISLFLGTIAGLSMSVVKTLMEDVCDDSELIEQITGTSIIGTIPWIENLFTDEHIQFVHGLAYDNIVSNLIMKCSKNQRKIITFTSSSLKKPQSTIIYYLALRLQKLGNSVVILDSDFRIPTISKTAGIDDKIKMNLSELIVAIEKKFRSNPEAAIEKDVINALITDGHGIQHLGNTETIFDPYEFFGTNAFETILNTLKNNFDWVLVDTGAAQITPEFIIISKISDGVVLFVNKTITFTTIKNITKTLKNANIPFLGAIMRETSSRLEKEYEKYLRFQETQLLEDEDLLTQSIILQQDILKGN